jgi:hypothetical protein
MPDTLLYIPLGMLLFILYVSRSPCPDVPYHGIMESWKDPSTSSPTSLAGDLLCNLAFFTDDGLASNAAAQWERIIWCKVGVC